MCPHGLLGSGPPKTPGSILCRQQEQEEEAESSGLLQVLARQGHCDTIRHLLSQGTEALDRQDDHGRTPLFWATEYRHESLVELMLTHGADTAARDNEGNLCLHWAAYVGSAPIVKLLLEAGSDLNAPNHQGDRPLHLAAQEGRYECLVLLLAHGAKVFLKNEAGQLPLQCARPQSPCWKALQAACAHPPYQPERILSRDISRGFERLPIPCLNGLDQEPCPSNFLYVTRNIKSDAVASGSASWDHDQPCQCPVTCSASDCPCVLRSQRFWYTTDGRLVPEAANPSAKMGTIHECGMLCSCPSSCSNRVVQKGLRTQLQLYRTPAKGWGVRTMQDLPLGFFVCQYFGELISSAEAAQREEDAYYFVVDAQAGKECCLDGRFYGNIGRFLNHSCQPNLTAVQVTVGLEGPGIAFFTTRDVQAGEELGFDYGDRFWEVKGRRRWACQCASPRCRYASPSSPTAAAGEPVGSGPLRGFALKSKRRIPLPRKAPRPGRPRDASRP